MLEISQRKYLIDLPINSTPNSPWRSTLALVLLTLTNTSAHQLTQPEVEHQ